MKTEYSVILGMQHITGIPRNQMTIASLKSGISVYNPARFIDAFVKNVNSKPS